MKKYIFLIPLLAVLGWGLLVPARPALAARELLASTFPVYLFTQNITEGTDHFRVRLMVDSERGCPHDYAPTPAELERLAQADVLVINGLGLEGFLSRALTVARADLKIIDASGGPQAADAAQMAGDQARGTALILSRAVLLDSEPLGHHHSGPNPHLFASPGTAALMARNIAEGLAAVDPERAEAYRQNGARLAADLETAAGTMREAGRQLGNPKVIVSHSIFEYLAADLGFEVVAYIEEEDGAEPTAARLSELARLARSAGVRAILADPSENVDFARVLSGEARIPVAALDLVASGPAEAPLDYYQKVMLTDLEVLTALFAAPAPAETPAAKKKK